MTADLASLLVKVRAATGRDAGLDAAIGTLLENCSDRAEVPPYSASVDACIDLIRRALPGWTWHVGYGPRGIVPYAVLSHGPERHEANAPTVPLALLAAILGAKTARAHRPA